MISASDSGHTALARRRCRSTCPCFDPWRDWPCSCPRGRRLACLLLRLEETARRDAIEVTVWRDALEVTAAGCNIATGSQGTARQLGRIGGAGRRDVRYTWQSHIIFSGFVPELSRVCFAKGGALMGAGMPAPTCDTTTVSHATLRVRWFRWVRRRCAARPPRGVRPCPQTRRHRGRW